MKFEKKLKIISETKILNFFNYKKIAATEEIFSHMSLCMFFIIIFFISGCLVYLMPCCSMRWRISLSSRLYRSLSLSSIS